MHVLMFCWLSAISREEDNSGEKVEYRANPRLKKDFVMIITLTADIEQALTEEARKQGRTPEQLALDSLRDRFLFPDVDLSLPADETSLADFLRGHLGVLHSSEHVPGGARMAENTGRKFASALAAQRQKKRS